MQLNQNSSYFYHIAHTNKKLMVLQVHKIISNKKFSIWIEKHQSNLYYISKYIYKMRLPMRFIHSLVIFNYHKQFSQDLRVWNNIKYFKELPINLNKLYHLLNFIFRFFACLLT